MSTMPATQALRERLISPPPQLTDEMLAGVRRDLALRGQAVVTHDRANRYAGQWNSPPLIWDGVHLSELLDEYNPDTGRAELAAEFFGEWYQVTGGDPAQGALFLTWVREQGHWRLVPSEQHCA